MDLRRAILDTSLELIATRGLAALSLREVARQLKVTHGAPYHHFKDRAGVLAALTEEGFVLLADELRRAVSAARGGPRQAFEACGRAYIMFALVRTAYFKVMFRPELSGHEKKPPAAGGDAFRVLLDVVERCQAAGLSNGLEPHAVALTGWATVHGLAALCVDGNLTGGADPDGFATTVCATLGAWLVNGPKSRARA